MLFGPRPSFRVIIPFALTMLALSMPMLHAPSAMGATPEHSANDVIVEGEGQNFKVTVVLQAKDNGTYHIQIAQTEVVTDNFKLLPNGSSEKKYLSSGETFNFSVRMVTLSAAVGIQHEVPYEVYQNDVLVSNGIVLIDVKEPKATPPGDLKCSTCGLIILIPLFLVGGLYIVQRRTMRTRTK